MMNVSDWKPSEDQERILRVFQDEDYKIDVLAACEKAGVNRRTFYYWTDHPEFIVWWNQRRERFWALRMGRLDAATWEGATGKGAPGNPQDRKLMYERHDTGYAPRERKQIEVSGGVDLSQMSQEQLERQAHAAGVKEPQIEGQGDGDAG